MISDARSWGHSFEKKKTLNSKYAYESITWVAYLEVLEKTEIITSN